jgi:hypothetical protein
MQYELSISEYNKEFHLVVESDIQKKHNGLFTFIIRVDKSNIVDYVLLDTWAYGKKHEKQNP